MKKIFGLLALLFAFNASAQVSTIPDENIDPSDSLEIIIDVNAFDVSVAHHAELLAAVADGEDLYIWTWKPAEHPSTHPFTNGTGSAPWKNSNDTLKLTNNGDGTYSWKIVPTLWYEVDATTVYNNDIHFLVKPKDGGGYGDPDRKSDDLVVKIDPPATDRDPLYAFPNKVMQDDVVNIVYDNWREEKASMQNLHEDSCYIHAKAYLTDGSFIEITNTFQVGNNPDLKMEMTDEGTFTKQFVPAEFFNLAPGQEIDYIEIIAMKKVFMTGADRVTQKLDIQVHCQ